MLNPIPMLISRKVLMALFLIPLLCSANIYAQSEIVQTDNIRSNSKKTEDENISSKDPKKASLYSAILPGAGQFYNEKYWKLPIVYAGFGTLIYFIDRNTKYYKDLKQAIIDYPDHDLKYFDNGLTLDQITRGKDIYKRYREMSFIFTAGFYIIQIIDATVDAYLFDWDVGEDISLRLEPAALSSPYSPYNNSFGVRACISF
jgi:Family of unknown function (DUF5683)